MRNTPTRLCVELLEDRVVPSTLPTVVSPHVVHPVAHHHHLVGYPIFALGGFNAVDPGISAPGVRGFNAVDPGLSVSAFFSHLGSDPGFSIPGFSGGTTVNGR